MGSNQEPEQTLDERKIAVITVEQVDAVLAQGKRIEEVLVDAVNTEAGTRQAIIDSEVARSRGRFWLGAFVVLAFAVLGLAGFIDSRHHTADNHAIACASARGISKLVNEDQATLRDAQARVSSTDPQVVKFFDDRIARYEAARPSLADC